MATLQKHQQAWLEAGIDTREEYNSGGGSSGVHTRTSTGYYWNGTNIVSAVAGELRSEEEIDVYFSDDNTVQSNTIAYNKTVPKGLLLEPQVTNELPYSNAVTSWSTVAASYADSGTAGLVSGENYMVITDSGGTGNHYVRYSLTLPTGDQCFSLLVKEVHSDIGLQLDIGNSPYSTVYVNIADNVFEVVSNASGALKTFGVIKYGTTGWYRVFVGVNDSGSGLVQMAMTRYAPSTDTFTASYLATGQTIQVGSIMVEDGVLFPTSYIPTSGSTATRNADSILHDYDYPVGDDGKTLGLTWSHYYPKAATNVLTTATSATGEFEATIATDASGNLDMSVKDSGATAVTAEHTYASGDEYSDRITQLDFESDDQIGFWEDNTQVGTSAAHSIATTDIFADGQFTIEGFGGRIHKLALDDPSGQSGNKSYLQLIAIYNEAIAETAAITDAPTALLIALAAIAETNPITDSPAALLALNLAVAETNPITDSPSVLKTIATVMAETAAIADTKTAVLIIEKYLAESLAVSDALVTSMIMLASIGESATLADLVASSQQFDLNVAESFSIADVLNSEVWLNSGIDESMSLADAFTTLQEMNPTLAESMSLADVLTTQMIMNVGMSESAGAADSPGRSLQLLGELAETAGVTDAFTNLIEFIDTMPESAAVEDVLSIALTALSEVAEGASVTDAVASQLEFSLGISESAALADLCVAFFIIVASIEETVAITDVVTSPIEYNLAIAESVLLTGVFQSGIILEASISESVSISDVIYGFFVSGIPVLTISMIPTIRAKVSLDPTIRIETEMKPTIRLKKE